VCIQNLGIIPSRMDAVKLLKNLWKGVIVAIGENILSVNYKPHSTESVIYWMSVLLAWNQDVILIWGIINVQMTFYVAQLIKLLLNHWMMLMLQQDWNSIRRLLMLFGESGPGTTFLHVDSRFPWLFVMNGSHRIVHRYVIVRCMQAAANSRNTGKVL